MKKLSFFLMAMLMSVMSFAQTTESVVLASGVHDGSKITWTIANGNITISQLKAASSTAVNASYISAPRMYKGHIFKFETAEGYAITNIDITYNGSYYGTDLFAGTVIGNNNTVTKNTTDITATYSTANGGTHKIATTSAEGESMIALQIPNSAASGYKQLRPTAIKITYVKAATTTPNISCGDITFGTVNSINNNTKEVEVVGENLSEAITATLEAGTAFSVEGTLNANGGILTIKVTATEEGNYTDNLVLTSGTTTKTVAVSAKVVTCEGKGTKEAPYTVSDLTKLGNPGTKAWVMGYIIGEIKDNELSTSGFENNSNIALADAIGETKKYAPIQLPTGAIRDALNLVSNPANLNKQVALYGALEAYFSMPGVKSVSEYEWVVVNHTITVSANPVEAGTVTGGGEFEETDDITVKAVANEGYEFVNWTENEVEVSTAAEYSFEVLADRNLVANFELIPPTKYTVTLSDNTGGFEPLTSGAGEYEEGAEVTVSAVDSEGWVFVGWMDENGDIVSNDYQYTFVIEGNVALVAIYAQLMALEVNDLEIITEPVVGLTGTAELMPGMTLSFELIVDDSEQGDDGEYYLTENSKVYLNEETELEFQEGIALIDMESKIAQAQVLAAMGETLYLFKLDMSAAPAEPVDLVVTDATIYEENEILFLTAPWEGKTIKAELPATEHQGWMMIEIHEGEDFSIAMSQNATIATVDNVLTITGVFTDTFTGDIYNVNISGKLPVAEEPVEIVGVVKRALQIGESTIILTHEADGTAHIYNVVDEEISELSQEGVVAVDPENAGDLLAISDIALTEDGKLLAINKIVCQAGDGQVDAGYKRGETRVYIWNDLAGAPSVWFTSKMSSNWYRSVQGHTMAYKGTSINGTLFTTGVTATGTKFRYSVYNVIDGVYTDPAVNDSEYYHYTKGSAQETTNVGANYELNVSPLAANTWVLDGELINPFEITDPLTYNTEVTAGATLNEDLGKKYNGASYVTVGEQVLMVAPYAAEDKLAGVKVLDITSGLATATVVATADLDAAVEATAAATAVAVAENVLTITLVGDATMHLLDVELEKGPATALENIAVEGKAVKAIINGQLVIIKNGVQYNAQGQVVK